VVILVAVVVLLQSACAGPAPRTAPARVSALPTRDGVSLVEGGRPILFYRGRTQPGREAWRVNYIHPLHSVDGAVITEDGPADHLHQRGVYWAWRRILVDGVQVADGWVGRDLALDVGKPVVREWPDGSAQIEVRVIWRAPAAGAPVALVEEYSLIRAYLAADGRRRVELAVRLRALRGGVALAGTDDDKGYGGISMRFANAERVAIVGDGRALQATTAAQVAGEVVEFRWPGSSAPWPARIAASCRVDGQPWTTWVLRQEPSMQNCAYPGSRPVELSMDRDLVLAVTLDIG
jgi:hypothetical protein